MSDHPFPGFPAFLEAAAQQLGRPEAAGPARRIKSLAALANLCAQAVRAEAAHVPAILAKAEEFRRQLEVASRAAELMLADVRATRTDDRGTRPVAKRRSPPGSPSREAQGSRED